MRGWWQFTVHKTKHCSTNVVVAGDWCTSNELLSYVFRLDLMTSLPHTLKDKSLLRGVIRKHNFLKLMKK